MGKRPTCTNVETYTSQEVIGGKPVMVPDGEFQAALPQLIQGDIFKDKGVVPLRVAISPHDRSFLFGSACLVRQQVSVRTRERDITE